MGYTLLSMNLTDKADMVPTLKQLSLQRAAILSNWIGWVLQPPAGYDSNPDVLGCKFEHPIYSDYVWSPLWEVAKFPKRRRWGGWDIFSCLSWNLPHFLPLLNSCSLFCAWRSILFLLIPYSSNKGTKPVMCSKLSLKFSRSPPKSYIPAWHSK